MAVGAGIALLAVASWAWLSRGVGWDGPLRIGFRESPPYYLTGPDGEPAGMAVDVMNAAAERLGVRLAWTRIQGASSDALREGRIDLWATLPLPTPARLHATDPWIRSDYLLVFRQGTAIAGPRDVVGRTVAIAPRPGGFEEDLAVRFLPGATLLNTPGIAAKLSRVCDGTAFAALAGSRESLALLTTRPPGCEQTAFAFAPVPGAMLSHGIGSTLAAARVADRLRSEIEDMAGDGSLTAIHARWSFTTGDELDAVRTLQQIRFRSRLWVGGVAILALALLVAIWLVVHNRAARRLAEEYARQQERYRVLFERNLAGVYRTSLDGRILDCNEAFARMLGCESREALLTHEAWDFYPDRASRESMLDRLHEEGSVTNQELVLRRVDGRPAVLLESVTLIHPGDGGTPFCEGTVVDVTRQRELEEQYRQAQKLESIGRLAGGVAHDFNNALTAINGYAELVLADLSPSTPAHAMMLEIRRAGQHAESLTRQLLAFSRRQHLQPAVINLNRVVTETRDLLRRVIGEDIDLVTNLAEPLANVRTDPDQIRQVLMNLAVNARDAMPGGGRLVIATSSVMLGATGGQEMGQPPGPYVRLTVSDTGHGMDPDTQRQVFEPFFTTKERGKGTGLGLSTVYGIVKQSGGYIRLHSRPGSGTSFVIDLPVADAELDETTRPAGQADIAGRETILVVEDQEDVRRLVVESLGRYGYRTLEAADGDEAERVCRQEPGWIDLVLADVVMPGRTGPEVAAHCLAMRPGIRVLYMSGYVDDMLSGDPSRARQAYIQKPFTPQQLAARVRAVLDAPQPDQS